MSNYFKKSFLIFLCFCTLSSVYAMDSKITIKNKIIGFISTMFPTTIANSKKFIQGLIFYPRKILSGYDYTRYSSFNRANKSGNLSKENLQIIKWYLDEGKVSLFDQALKSVIVNKYSAEDENLVIDLVSRLMKNNAKIDGETPLTLAVKHSKSNLISPLLECNSALVNACNNDGHAPISIILNNISQEENDTQKEINKIMLKKLVQGGLDINSTHKIPLIEATVNTNFKQVKFLLENGANANISTSATTTPLGIIISKILYENDIGLQNTNYAILEQLLEHGVEINSPIRNDRDIALVEAITHKNLALVEFLLEKKADVNVYSNKKCTYPIYVAIDEILFNKKDDQEAKYKILEKLLQCPKLDVGKSSPLIKAVAHQNLNLVRFLLQKNGTYIDLPEEREYIHFHGYTPLALAVKNRDLEMIKLLLESKANVNPPNVQYSPLSAAIESENCELVGLLLDNKADTSYSDKLISKAKKTNNLRMVQYLLNRKIGVTTEFSNNLRDTFVIENSKLEL